MRRPLPWASLLALLLVALAWVYLLGSETPRGQVRGTTVLSDAAGKPLSECDVYLTPATDDADSDSDRRERRHAVTDRDGRFFLHDVPAGAYNLSASARKHHTTDVSVTVTEGVTATETLDLTRSEADLSVGDHQATFTTGEAPTLPVRGYATLPVAGEPTMGWVAPLRVKIWRTRLADILGRADAARDLDALKNNYDRTPAPLTDALLHPKPGVAPAPELIADEEHTPTSIDREGFYSDKMPLAVTRGVPGLYLVKFSYGTFSAASSVLVTDLALVVKRSPGAILAYTANLHTGVPVPGATVRVLRGGKSAAGATTGADGLARLLTPPVPANDTSGDAPPTLTMATWGKDEAVISRSDYGDAEGVEKNVVHVITDRTVYRPGDTVSYKGIVRTRRADDAASDTAPGYTVPRGLPITVEMRDASGGLIRRDALTTSNAGTFHGAFETSSEGATGTYTIVTKIGGVEQISEVPVAAYRKPEFAVTVTPTKKRYLRGEPVEMTVAATYYFGAPVAGAKVHYDIARDADWAAEYGQTGEGDDPGDAAYSDYRKNTYSAYYGETVATGDVTLDENGVATVRVRTDIRHPEADKDDKGSDNTENKPGGKKKPDDEPIPQAEVYTLSAEVSEPDTARSVVADGAATVAAGEVTVNVQPEGYVSVPGKPTQIFVRVTGADGKPAVGTPVTLAAVYDVWNKAKKEAVPQSLGPVQTAKTGEDGRAFLSVTPSKGGEIRLTATATDAGGRVVRAEGSLWAASDSDDLDTDYGDLSLLTDKRHYEPGDTARVLVNVSRTGQNVLLCVEGDRVYETFSVRADKHSTVVHLPIKTAWGPNVSLSATYVRDKKIAQSETPLRVSLPARQLAVSVKPAGGTNYHPGDAVTYQITTADALTGKPVAASLSLSVVDEAIYALREDDPKALRTTFYPRRQNRVSTSYSFSIQYLGDVNKAEPVIKARTRFRDTALWLPDIETGADGRASATLTLPDNLTTWRATVNAVSADTAVGYARSKIVSSKPFLVRLETPRYLVAGDKSQFTALVHNDTGAEQSVRVRLVAATLKVDTADTQSFTVPAGGTGTATWAVTPAANTSEPAPLRVTAWTIAQNGQPQFTDGLEKSLPTRAFGRVRTTTFAGVTGADDAPLSLHLDPAAVRGETRLSVRVTPSVAGALVGATDYLIGFPYGCTEQTMSRFYPDLLVERFDPAAHAKNAARLPRMVRDSIARLARFQHSASGGWGWWEHDKDDAFLTAYVLIGLSTARDQGYAVPPALLSEGIKAAEKMATTVPVRERPFLLYALSEAGYDDSETHLLHTPFVASAHRTKFDPATLPTDSLCYLVLLGHRLGADYKPYYAPFAAEVYRRGVPEGRLIHWSAFPDKPGKKHYYYEYDSCSDRMATALALRVMLLLDPASPRIPAALRYLMQSRTDGYFGDTRDTAWVLVALTDYLRTHPEQAAPPHGVLTISVNGTAAKTLDLSTLPAGEREAVVTLPPALLRFGANTVQLSGGAGLFYSGALRQTVAAPAGAELPAIADNTIMVKRELLRVASRKAGDNWRLDAAPVPGNQFKQGEQLRIRLVITTTRAASYVLIEDAFPSGAEVTERGTADEETGSGGDGYFWYDHVDVRDDRIAFFVRALPAGKHVLEYNLRAQTPGITHALPATVTGMYDASLHGESDTAVMEVRP